MPYEAATHFAQTWGLALLTALFLAALFYAVWPANGATFNRAAHAPLDREADDDQA
ncbi:MAG: CcoQ/FixQ family Cbb3-type cytochrome c oxidase assembly chaperone [Alphaproteobacteria bacterium]|nr:CcoQ/FixQ family Cbb3-type cytochrome c oxidase assembly chaperone [Alphaproteobacteria bacterium]